MSGGRGIVAAGRRKPPARPRRKAGTIGPARPLTHRYRDFDDWIEMGSRLAAYYAAVVAVIESIDAEDAKLPPADAKAWLWSEQPDERLRRRRALDEAAEALLLKFSAEDLDAAVAEYSAGWRWFECDDLYEGPSDRRVIGADFVAGRVAALIGAYPSGSPASPEVFTRRMIEEIIATEPTASRVESATRSLVRSRTFLPSIAEVLAAIRNARVVEWGEGAFEVDDGEVMVIWARAALERRVASDFAPAPRLPAGAHGLLPRLPK